MKSIITSLFCLIAICGYSAGQSRPQIFSYNNRDLALAGDPSASSYVQQLGGQWKYKELTSINDVSVKMLGADTDAASWSECTVPQKGSINSPVTIYRREFKMPFAWVDRQVFVHIGAVRRAYDLYINEKRVDSCANSSSYTEFDITKYLNEGKNYIAIVALAEPETKVLEGQIATLGSALAGDIYIMAQPKVRIRDYVTSTLIQKDSYDATFSFGVVVKSHLLNTKDVITHYELISPQGEMISSGRKEAKFYMRGEDTVRFVINVKSPYLWSHEQPALYTLNIRLQHEGRFTEYASLKIGMRQLEFSENGFRINSQPLEIRAIDYTPPTDQDALRKDFIRFKKEGINTLRVASFPQDDQFYSMCDRFGFYVCDQANLDSRKSSSSLKVGGTTANDPKWEREYADRVLDMYYRNQNHPCIIMFSLGGNAHKGYNMYEAYLRLKEVERIRPVIYQNAGNEWNTDIICTENPSRRDASDKRYSLRFMDEAYWAANPPKAGSFAITQSSNSQTDFRIRNGHELTNLSNMSINYVILHKGKPVQNGYGSVKIDAAPAREGIFKIDTGAVKPGNYTVKITLSSKHTSPWLDEEQVIQQSTFPLTVPKPPKTPKTPKSPTPKTQK